MEGVWEFLLIHWVACGGRKGEYIGHSMLERYMVIK